MPSRSCFRIAPSTSSQAFSRYTNPAPARLRRMPMNTLVGTDGRVREIHSDAGAGCGMQKRRDTPSGAFLADDDAIRIRVASTSHPLRVSMHRLPLHTSLQLTNNDTAYGGVLYHAARAAPPSRGSGGRDRTLARQVRPCGILVWGRVRAWIRQYETGGGMNGAASARGHGAGQEGKHEEPIQDELQAGKWAPHACTVRRPSGGSSCASPNVGWRGERTESRARAWIAEGATGGGEGIRLTAPSTTAWRAPSSWDALRTGQATTRLSRSAVPQRARKLTACASVSLDLGTSHPRRFCVRWDSRTLFVPVGEFEVINEMGVMGRDQRSRRHPCYKRGCEGRANGRHDEREISQEPRTKVRRREAASRTRALDLLPVGHRGLTQCDLWDRQLRTVRGAAHNCECAYAGDADTEIQPHQKIGSRQLLQLVRFLNSNIDWIKSFVAQNLLTECVEKRGIKLASIASDDGQNYIPLILQRPWVINAPNLGQALVPTWICQQSTASHGDDTDSI
ncbi:hypothetical protein C8R45DRAFT_939760 [Mycena sanguinolenta]|nr:hypothetical protein C8R45DRAFT_939760 [Mycena sanguinolenta]